MLKPAQLYKEALNKKMLESWYKPENIYWHSGTGEYTVDLPDNNAEYHQFVSVDKNDNILGYIMYKADWQSMAAIWWGIIAFKKGSYIFAKDVLKAVDDVFRLYRFQKIEFSCYSDNPVISAYKRYVALYGGTQSGYHHRASKLMDGQVHDSVDFEILSENYFEARGQILLKRGTKISLRNLLQSSRGAEL